MAGRAARSLNGEVILYADFLTNSIRKTIEETARRRKIQKKFNVRFGIIPKGIEKEFSIELIKNPRT